MQHLGFEVLVTILLPGTLILLAVINLLFPYLPPETLATLSDTIKHSEALLGIAALVGSGLLGMALACFMGFVEWFVLDPMAADRLGMSVTRYWGEWYAYVDHLERRRNIYIARLVQFFFFESRCAVAGFVLVVSLERAPPGWMPSRATWWVLSGAILLAYMAYDTHFTLAVFRHRRFGKASPLGNECDPAASEGPGIGDPSSTRAGSCDPGPTGGPDPIARRGVDGSSA